MIPWPRLSLLLCLVGTVLSLTAFGYLACYLSSLYPIFPEMLCDPPASRVFEALLGGSLVLFLASIAGLSRSPTPGSPAFTLLAGATAGAALALLVRVLGLVRELLEIQLDAGCERAAGSLLLRTVSLAYVGPMLSLLLAAFAVAVTYRAHRQAF